MCCCWTENCFVCIYVMYLFIMANLQNAPTNTYNFQFCVLEICAKYCLKKIRNLHHKVRRRIGKSLAYGYVCFWVNSSHIHIDHKCVLCIERAFSLV